MGRGNKIALVLDDELLIAMDIEHELRGLGYEHVELLSTIDECIVWLQSANPDIAIIDYHIRGRACTPVIEVLKARGIATVIHSGNEFELEYHGEDFASFPWLNKPSTRTELVDAITKAQSKLTTD